ncbi:Ribosomal RNA small subunit methyltransferase I [Synechococcus sp. MIT S9509]|uniref:16S rRNA (cytidine(1402)-2'-O)-methyltransferase n=1 Tax=unclassified Synechococcus TaxID=2626047 RepID=UPI0007BB9904|nr:MULTISPECIES: 16S rRNA (cytidine(1402)-2'-O)-methyltransferase [unclassified Synechococcus]KZR87022.1 Ribosomal RNA small subunit methyltransferase I [Synechococcus sp. MIT S9504]KZR93094.1 Ribosomal RNA small subunit methyltransferase I [Synechococcus sp. MIT S9509]
MKQRAEPEAGVLYLVGTPIGHLGDLSPRARALLVAVDTIACEDTRHSGQLLTALGSKARRCSFHQHNTYGRIPQLLNELSSGHSVAVISDAGLPGISDPGEELVAAARQAGHAVICIPGPCAATTALVSSGLPSGRFCFEGFLPAKGRERRESLAAVVAEERTTVLYEAPHRLVKLLEELQELCGDQRALQVTRELTKRHEQQVGPTVIAALEHFKEHPPQGEFTLVLGGAPQQEQATMNDDQCRQQLAALIKQGMKPSDAAKDLSRSAGRSRRELYALLHENQKQAD